MNEEKENLLRCEPMYTVIKIKKKENFQNVKNFLFRANTPHIYSNYLNKSNKNSINRNNKFELSQINKEKYRHMGNSKGNKIRLLTTSNININKNIKSFSINTTNRINKNKTKYKLDSNLLNNTEKYKYENDYKRKNTFTYNFVKDTQKMQSSTIILRKKSKNKNKNKSTLNENNKYMTNLIQKINKDSQKQKIYIDNKRLQNYMLKKEWKNNNYNLKSNSEKNKSESKDKKIHFKIGNKLNFKRQLIDSPDSIFFYIYNFINERKINEDHKIYLSKINMEKKFRHYKKDLEKLEQVTNNELFNLKRQIIPEHESRLIIKYN